MQVELNNIFPMPGSHYRSKRVGRGIGSGKGKTCGSGTKGQRSRTGVAIKGFEGGQMPLHRRLPKRGFKNKNKIYHQVINIDAIEQFINLGKLTGNVINKEVLFAAGIIAKKNVVLKLLAKNAIATALNFTVDAASGKAVTYIQQAGGTITITKESVTQ